MALGVWHPEHVLCLRGASPPDLLTLPPLPLPLPTRRVLMGGGFGGGGFGGGYGSDSSDDGGMLGFSADAVYELACQVGACLPWWVGGRVPPGCGSCVCVPHSAPPLHPRPTLRQGIKPWDDDAAAALDVLYDYGDDFFY